MDGFSIGEAGVAGLRLIVQRPMAVLAWGLTYLVIYGLPLAGVMMFVLPDYGAILSHAGQPGFAPGPEINALVARMQIINLPMMICPVIARGFVYSAICRAVLEPQDSAFAYLRASTREMWVGLVAVVAAILVVLAMLAAAIVVGIPVGVLAIVMHSVANPGLGVLLVFAVVLFAFAVAVWLALRLSICVPMSFADNDFRLFEAWSATRGLSVRLFLTALLAMVVAWLFELVLFSFLLAVILVCAFHGHWDPVAFGRSMQANPAGWMAATSPWIIVTVSGMCLVMGAMAAIIIAPFATVYQAIRPSLEDRASANATASVAI